MGVHGESLQYNALWKAVAKKMTRFLIAELDGSENQRAKTED